MGNHNCIRQVRRTQTSGQDAAKAVPNPAPIKLLCESRMGKRSPNGANPVVTLLGFDLLNELYN